MIAIGSAAAAPATPLRRLAAASAGPAQDTAAASALLDQIASRTRDGVSTRDLGALMATLQPALNEMSADQAATAMGSLLGDVATRRAAGTDGVVFVVAIPDGGVMATSMSAADFAKALASDDPKSLGWVSTADGKTTYYRDILREALGLGTAPGVDGNAAEARPGDGSSMPGLSIKDQVAAAIARMMQAAACAADTGDTDQTAAGVERRVADGAVVNLLAIPGKAADPKQGGSAALLDVLA